MDDLETIDLSAQGGIAVVILAKGIELPKDFAFHPQILAYDSVDLPNYVDDLSEKIPSTARVVLIGGELPGDQFSTIRAALARRHLTYITRRNPVALDAALRQVLPTKKPPVVDADVPANGNGNGARSAAPKGSLSELIKEANLSKGSAEEARRLFALAQSRGITTTVGSLQTGISNRKRREQVGGVVKSVMSPQQKAVSVLDDAIMNLQLIRDYVVDTEAANAELSQKVAAFRKLLA